MKKDFFYNWHKDKLQNQTTDVDVDEIWAAIEPEVDGINAGRKKRKGFFLFLFGLFFFILGAGFMLLLRPSTTSKTSHITNTDHTKVTTPKVGTQIDINTVAERIESENISIPPTTENKVHKTNSSTLIPSEISSSSKKASHVIIHTEPTTNRPQNITSKVYLKDKNFNSGTTEIMQNQGSNSITRSTSNSSLISANYTSDDEKIERPSALETIPTLSPKDVSYSSSDDLPIQQAIALKKKSAFRFSLGLYSGVGLVNRSLSVKTDTDGAQLLQLREASEKSLELLNSGIKFGIQHKSGLFGSIGFQYARVAERFQFDEDVLQLDSLPNQVIGFSNNLLGDRNIIRGTVPNNTVFDLEYNFYNNYHLLEIPLTLGYKKTLSLWSIGVRGSYIQNVSLRTKGRIFNGPIDVANITGDNDIFKNKLNASFEGALLSSYRLAPRIELGLEVYYRHIPESITRSQYALDQNYNWIGINTTLNYLF